jgi:hypothetical protein
MGRIAILDDEPEVVVLIYQFLTHGHHAFFKMVGDTRFMLESLVAFRPDVIVVPLFRRREAIGRAVVDYMQDISGAQMLETISAQPEFSTVPIILFGFSTLPDEMPTAYRLKVHYSDFLFFPEGLQLLNPIISGYVGSASGTAEDFARLKQNLADYHAPPPGHDPDWPKR